MQRISPLLVLGYQAPVKKHTPAAAAALRATWAAHAGCAWRGDSTEGAHVGSSHAWCTTELAIASSLAPRTVAREGMLLAGSTEV